MLTRRGLITGAAALAAYSQMEDAEAVNRLLLLGGVPHLPGSAVDMNFAAGQYYGGSLSSLISVSRASQGYVTNSDGTLTLVGNNLPRIGRGTGLLIEQQSTNLVTYSIFSGSLGSATLPTGWIVTGASAAIAMVAGPALGVLTNIAQYRRVGAGYEGFQLVSGMGNWTNATYTVSVYLRVPTGVTPQDCGLYLGAATPTIVTIASQAQLAAQPPNVWVSYQATFTVTAASGSQFSIISSTASGAGNGWDVIFPQLESGSIATSYIPTTSSTVTRAADNVTIGGLLLTTIQGAQGSNVIAVGPSPNISVQPCIIFQNNREIITANSNTAADTWNGVRQLNGNLGSGTFSSAPRIKGATGWSAAGTSIVVNNGAVGTDSNTLGVVTGNYYLGSSAGGSRFYDGYIQRLTAFSSRLPDATLQALTV